MRDRCPADCDERDSFGISGLSGYCSKTDGTPICFAGSGKGGLFLDKEAMPQELTSGPQRVRLSVLDTLRGITLVSMILYHAAWDAVSGAAKWTISRYCRNGILYCSISSSVVRSRLFLDRKDILEKINAFLRDDGLFVKDDPRTGFLRDIVLK